MIITKQRFWQIGHALLLLIIISTNLRSEIQPNLCLDANLKLNENSIMDCNTAPVITCPSLYFGCVGDSTDPADIGYATAIPGDSGCEQPIVTYQDFIEVNEDCYYELHRLWTAKYPGDANPWLYADCTQIIVLKDDKAPTIGACPADFSINSTANCHGTAKWNDPIPNDNCGLASFEVNYPSGSSFPIGTTTVIYVATDNCGLSTTCSFDVTVIGECCDAAPIITCPNDVLVCPNSSTTPSLTGQATAVSGSSECNGPIEITYTDNIQALGDCDNSYKITRTWMAFMMSDPTLFSTCQQTINVRDLESPVTLSCSGNINVEADGSSAIVNYDEPTFSDNCGIDNIHSTHSSGDYFPLGCTTVTYTAYDVCGNVTACSFVICVEDTSCQTAPVITCPPNRMRCPGTGAAGYHPNSTGYATATAGGTNCGDPIVSYSDDYHDMPGCPGGMKIYRTWTATDPEDPTLFSTCLQMINLNDPVSPTVVTCQPDITVETTESGMNVNWTTPPTFTDNCGIENVSSTHVNGQFFTIGTTTVVYTATDMCGNSTSCSFNVTVNQLACNAPPIITCPPNRMRCPNAPNAAYHPNSTGYATAVAGGDHCGEPIITFTDVEEDMPGCIQGRKIYRTWKATDPENPGLVSTCTQIINLNDPISPTVVCADDVVVNSTDNNSVIVSFENPTFSDNCGIHEITCSHQSGDTFPVGITTVTCSAEDYCGNTVSCSFEVDVRLIECATAPIISCPEDATLCVNGDYTPSALGFATATSGGLNCGNPIVSYIDIIIENGPCNSPKVIHRKWTATDPNNSALSSLCYQTINLIDTEAPVVIGCSGDISATGGPNCDVAVTWEAPVVTDNCSNVTVTSNYQSGDIFYGGNTEVIYTFTDACGNQSSCSFHVIVACGSFGCAEVPTINCPADKYLCVGSETNPSVTGHATATPGLSSCEEPIVSYTDVIMSTGPCAGAKVIKRIWKAEDPIDGTIFSTCEQFITTTDNSPPTFIYCPDDLVLDGGAWCDAVAAWGPVTATDNCQLPNITSNYTSGVVLGAGVTEIIYTATDACGNQSTCSFNVIVTCNDPCNQPPVINCPGSVTLCPGSAYDPSITGNATATPSNNCSTDIDIIYHDQIITNGPCTGAMVIERTWTAKDPMDPSLQSHCTQIITLGDNIPPAIWECPTDITVNYGSAATWYLPSADDNCGVQSLVSTHDSGTVFPVGVTTVTYTAEDFCGNVVDCHFNVTVLGQSGHLECPDDISVQCAASGGTYVNWNTPSYTGGSCGDCNDQQISGFMYMGSYNGHQYYCSLNPANWNTASSICQANGGYLAAIDDAGENAFLANILTIQSAWIGGNDLNNEGTFEWTNGSPFNYTNWYPGQPNNYNYDQHCVEMLHDGTWNDQYAITQLEFIMELPCSSVHQISGPQPGSHLEPGVYEVVYQLDESCGTETCSFNVRVESSITMKCPDDVTIACPSGASGVHINWDTPVASSCCSDCGLGGNIPGFMYMGTHNGHYYYCSLDPATWPQANSIAQANGGYLAAIGDETENEFLAGILTIQSAYIGLNDANNEGQFTWSNGEPFGYSNWYPQQPNDYNGFQDYVELLSNGQWNDQYNNQPLEFIMEIPGCINIQQIGGPAAGTYIAGGTTTTITYQATDDCGNVETCSFNVTVDKNECNSGGLNSDVCWIEHIGFGDINNTTGSDGGYEDYTNQCTTVQPGIAYPISLTPWCTSNQHKVFWKVWIDFNMDGDFNDNGEFVAYGNGAGTINGNITMPLSGIWSGSTTMRIAMKLGTYPTGPCEVFSHGETEDYCLEIINADVKGDDTIELRSSDKENEAILLVGSKEEIDTKFQISPNPATDFIHVQFSNIDKIIESGIYNVAGKKIMSIENLNDEYIRIALSKIENGIYFLNAIYENGKVETQRFIVQK